MPRTNLIQFRRGTAAAWTSADPTLAAGEIGVETDTNRSKVGDGSTAWSSLAYHDAPARTYTDTQVAALPTLAVGSGLSVSTVGGVTTISLDSTLVKFYTSIGLVQSVIDGFQSGGTTSTMTLPAAPTAGNLLVALIRARRNDGAVDPTHITTPAGFTLLSSGEETALGNVAYKLCAKISDGTETSVDAAFGTAPTNHAFCYMEFTGLLDPAGIGYDSSNSISATVTGTTYNPAAVTPDRNRALLLAFVCVDGDSGGMTSNFQGADGSLGHVSLQLAYKAITNGDSWDTTGTWTTSTSGAIAGVAVFRGEL